jgi:hypothetical protein
MTTTQNRFYKQSLPPGMREMVEELKANALAFWVPLADRLGGSAAATDIRPELAAPAPPPERPKRQAVPAFVEPKKLKIRVVRAAKQVVSREDCLHAKWQRQGKEGTRYARYERCTSCGTSRVIGEARKPGRARTTPVHEPADCPHLPEWHVAATKNGGPALRCLSCRAVRISFEAPKPVVDYKKLMRELAVEAGIDWETVMSKDSHAPVVAVRRRCVAAMREHGLSVREIAEKLNLAAATVHYLMRHGGGL